MDHIVQRVKKDWLPYQEYLEYFVVIFVGGENEGRDVRRVVGRHVVHGLPGVGLTWNQYLKMMTVLCMPLSKTQKNWEI